MQATHIFVKVFIFIFALIHYVKGLSLNPLLGSNMVLQRSVNAVLWGNSSSPLNTITIQIDENRQEVYSVSSSTSLEWIVSLKPQTASTNRKITITEKETGEIITLTNIAFGDVYLCSGQSNMEMSVNGAFDSEFYIAEANDFPDLRFFSVQKKPSLTTLTTVESKDPRNKAWNVASNETVSSFNRADHFSVPSATCYFTMRQLYKQLNGKVPIGFVASSYGGTAVQAWSNPDALAKCPQSVYDVNNDDDVLINSDSVSDPNSDSDFDSDPDPNANSVLWNGMIYPLLNFRFNGALWYQGESNAGQAAYYACAFPAMINSWRSNFESRLPFFFVQIASYSDATWPVLRDAQLAALNLPDTGYAVAIDLGDLTSPDGSIHPRSKPAVGGRLFLPVWDVVYGGALVETGPNVESINYDYEKQVVTITFVNEEAGNDLFFNGTADCSSCCSSSPFSLYLSSSPLSLIPVSATLSVSSSGVSMVTLQPLSKLPTGSRVGGVLLEYEADPQCALYNGAGLPATPFNLTLS